MSSTDWIVLCCGIGTFLLRWLPMRGQARVRASAAADGLLQRWLRGIGPAAIAALLAVSFWPMLAARQDWRQVAAIVLALVLLAGLKRRFGGIAGPTLIAAAAYGALYWAWGLAPLAGG